MLGDGKPLNSDLGRFDVVYCDPPYRYRFPISKSRRIENHYPTMPLEDIC